MNKNDFPSILKNETKIFWRSHAYLSILFFKIDQFQFVDVIHTDAGQLGAAVSTGDVDFWPNGGVIQPGCPLSKEPLCDHARSWFYFAESVAYQEPRFDAIKCKNYETFIRLNCSDQIPFSNMGINASLR